MIGYARVSTADQDPQLQLDALETAGCERVFQDNATGATADRAQLNQAMDFLRSGDTFIVWRLDRLGRSLQDLISIVNSLEERRVAFRSLTESIDTASPAGRLTFHVFCSLAEFERDLIRERTYAGLAAARSRGRTGGRPRVVTSKKLSTAKTLLSERNEMGRSVYTVSEVAQTVGVSRASLYRALRADPAPSPSTLN